MTSMNERIRAVRKTLGFSQVEFANELGISQRAVSWGEQPGNNVPDSTVKSICRAFRVREEWLRSGTGEMYDQAATFSLDRFVADRGATDLELEIVKAYFEMPVELRKAVLEHFKGYFSGEAGGGTESAEAAYEKTLESLRSTDSTASNTTADEKNA